ncbi:hypothetical protein [Sphingosinicella terrae]|uniref:hypothetical protein n=1 Tax=Sphingosinicella terrae TaxID=2172047 RepID=UPI0013B4470E|nr:hypothetical protein [Sphingosinicella terrae]
MKTATFAIALLMSGAAFAQTYGPTDAQPDVAAQAGMSTDPATDATHDMSGHDMTIQGTSAQDMATQGTTAQDMTTQDMTTQGTTTQDTTVQSSTRWSDTAQTGTTTLAANTAPAGGAIVQPSNADPERDARGIAVMSDAATVPAGYNGIAATAAGGPLLDPATGEPAQDGYPPCTASVTDNCLQTYERGRSAQ